MLLPIGSDCCISIRMIEHFGHSPQSPFHNVLTNFQTICQCLQNENIFDKGNWEYMCTTNEKYKAIRHKYMHYISLHDIPDNYTDEESYIKLQKDKSKAYDNFKILLKNVQCRFVCVIDDYNELNKEHLITNSDVYIFFNSLKKISNVNHKLIFITNTFMNIHENENVKIINTNYYIKNDSLKNWYRDNINWNEIFKNI